MSLASLLLQPKKLGKAKTQDPMMGLVEDLMTLAVKLAIDQTKEGEISKILEAAFVAGAIRMVEGFGDSFQQAKNRMQVWVQPFKEQFEGMGDKLETMDDFSQVIAWLLENLNLIADGLEDFSIEDLRLPIQEVMDMIEEDLGIDSVFVENMIWELLDDIVTRLKTYPPDISREDRQNRHQMISVLRRLKRQMKNSFKFPMPTAEDISGALMAWLRKIGFDKIAKKVACHGGNMNSVFDLMKNLPELPGFENVFGFNSVGAAANSDLEKTYAWYASWVMGDRYRSRGYYFIPFWPKDDIFINETKDKYIRENFCRSKKEFNLTASDGDWKKIPHFDPDSAGNHDQPYFTFDEDDMDAGSKATRDSMEKAALYLAGIAEYLEGAMHLLSIEEGDEVSNTLHAVGNLVFGSYILGAKKPPNSVLRFCLYRLLCPILGSFQGMHTKSSAETSFILWITVFLGNIGEGFIYGGTASGVRNLVLSMMTLLNYHERHSNYQSDPFPSDRYNPDDRPDNRLVIDGVADPFISLAGWCLAKATPREHYGHPFAGGGERCAQMWLLWGVLAGTGFGFLGALVGTIVAEMLSWEEDFPVLGWKMLQGAEMTFVMFWASQFTTKEGDTDEGKFNPRGDDFAGYPSPGESPYRLPWAGSRPVYCPQGNQGYITHNAFATPAQVYAYDFALDQDVEILCSRDGIVDAYYDDHDNGSDGSWNYIRIRHDTVNNDHDKGPGGGVVTTYAVYGHGRKGSVEAAFNDRGIAKNNIKNSPVTQGQVIMRSGDTGNSAYNHLHMHVLPQTTGGAVGDNTIPFVFRDAKHRDLYNVLSQDGVPKTMNHYISENTRTG